MIPFGLLAGFADNEEIRITEIAENGFCFRMAERVEHIGKFRICFCEEISYSEKADDSGQKNFRPYREIEIKNFKLEEQRNDEFGIPVYTYSAFVDQENYKECVSRLIMRYDRYVRLKLNSDDGELAQKLTGYPAEKDEIFSECLNWQKREWFCENESAGRNDCILKKACDEKTPHGNSEDPIEFAVELDRLELYERYLSMKLEDFMRWYWKKNQAEELGKKMPLPGRIYIGNTFCHMLAPGKEQIFEILEKAEHEKISVTITFTYLREFMVRPVEKLLDELAGWCKARKISLEIAANDWGLLELLRERKQILLPCMGTLLNKLPV